MNDEWLTTVNAAKLWEKVVGGAPTVFEIPSGNRFMRMARSGELAGFGIQVTRFAGRYAINKESLLRYIYDVCADTVGRIEREMPREWAEEQRKRFRDTWPLEAKDPAAE